MFVGDYQATLVNQPLIVIIIPVALHNVKHYLLHLFRFTSNHLDGEIIVVEKAFNKMLHILMMTTV